VSVLKQSYQNFEIIVINDGSSDDTLDKLKQFKNSDNFSIYSTKNNGVSAARNLGISNAKGEWIACLDSDDEWLPKKLQIQYQMIQAGPELHLFHGEEIWIRNGIRVNQSKKYKKGGGDLFGESLKLCAIGPSVAVFRKSVFLELGGFDENYPCCEDYDLWLRFTSLYEVGFIDEFLIQKHGGHEDQLSTSFVAMDYWRIKAIAAIIKNRELSAERLELAHKVLANKCKILIKGYIKHDNTDNLAEIESILANIES